MRHFWIDSTTFVPADFELREAYLGYESKSGLLTYDIFC